MMKITPSETILRGHWLFSNGQYLADDTCQRIETLVKTYLAYLESDESGWDLLYIDTDDGRLWEKTYPQSELHGGGPPLLRCITEEDATRKYHWTKKS
jgi:hypothetical protein